VIIRIYRQNFKTKQAVDYFAILKIVQNELSENLERVREKIINAARRAGRNAEEIKLIAVSKTHPVEVLNEALQAGATVFGENKIQEAETKITKIGREKAEWHLIGHLQSNKVRKAVKLFDLIHTLDSVELAERLERICEEENRAELPILIQVDLAGESTKNGISESELPNLLKTLETFRHLKTKGFMIIPPYDEDVEKVRSFFRRLREIRDEFLPGGELSMGMSHDFETAIEEGATLVRVGTAIFGERDYRK
jgi:PLP dependent protein